MQESLEDKKLVVTTKPSKFICFHSYCIAEMKIENLIVTKNRVSFSLKSNINREVKCSLLDAYGDLVVSVPATMFKADDVSFKALHSHSTYFINCQAFSRKTKNNDITSILAETKPIEITTKRSFIQIFSSLIISVMVISIIVLSVLAVIRYRMEYGSSKLYCIE